MNQKGKRLFIWDLKELNGFTHKSVAVEPFNMWPSGNCGHVYSSSNQQAKRHISGWAMRNTNNHNINILKKSCLGVLVCNRSCRRADSSIVAIRPAICDKARRKQIGRKCPNGCGGQLIMQQCKGHNGYPVTHFWRHFEDKVFFIGKGFHDHPKPELKLSSEKRRAYTKNPNKIIKRSRSIQECLPQTLRQPYSTPSALLENDVTKIPPINTSTYYDSLYMQQNISHQFNQQPTQPLDLQHQSPYSTYSLNSHNRMDRLYQPKITDHYLFSPTFNDGHLSTQFDQVNLWNSMRDSSINVFDEARQVYQDYYHPTISAAVSAANPKPIHLTHDVPTCLPSLASCSYSPMDYSCGKSMFSEFSYPSKSSSSTVFSSSNLPKPDDSSVILDLSLETQTANSWRNEYLESSLPASKYENRNQDANASTSSNYPSRLASNNQYRKGFYSLKEKESKQSKIMESRVLEIPKLTNEMHSLAGNFIMHADSAAAHSHEPRAQKPSLKSYNSNLDGSNDQHVTVQELIEIDNLDMSDISNIVNLSAASGKFHPRQTSVGTAEEPTSGTTLSSLPALSSFLRGIDYL